MWSPARAAGDPFWPPRAPHLPPRYKGSGAREVGTSLRPRIVSGRHLSPRSGIGSSFICRGSQARVSFLRCALTCKPLLHPWRALRPCAEACSPLLAFLPATGGPVGEPLLQTLAEPRLCMVGPTPPHAKPSPPPESQRKVLGMGVGEGPSCQACRSRGPGVCDSGRRCGQAFPAGMCKFEAWRLAGPPPARVQR